MTVLVFISESENDSARCVFRWSSKFDRDSWLYDSPRKVHISIRKEGRRPVRITCKIQVRLDCCSCNFMVRPCIEMTHRNDVLFFVLIHTPLTLSLVLVTKRGCVRTLSIRYCITYTLARFRACP